MIFASHFKHTLPDESIEGLFFVIYQTKESELFVAPQYFPPFTVNKSIYPQEKS